MTGFKEQLERLEKSDELSAFRKDNPESYLAYGFNMIPGDFWQIGYYLPKKDRLVTFVMAEKIEQMPEAEAFKENDSIKEFDASHMKIDFDEAKKICDETLLEKCPGKEVTKKIFIIQHLDIGQVWNVTIVTNDFNTLNVRLDIETGVVKSTEIVNLMDLAKMEKGERKRE